MKTPQLVNRLLFSKIFTALWIIALAAGAVSLLLLTLGIAPGTIVTTIGKGSLASWQKFSRRSPTRNCRS